MWQPIFIREIRELIVSLRFLLSSFLIVGLMILSAVIHDVRGRRQLERQATVLTSYAAALELATIDALAGIEHPALKPPAGLAFLAEGGQTATPDAIFRPLSPLLEPSFGSLTPSFEQALPRTLDWAFLLRAVLSLVAFVLGYDAICGSRQRALLKLVLSYPLSRRQVLLAKFLALGTCLSVPVVSGAVLSLLILGVISHLPLGVLVGSIAQMTVLALLAIAFYVLVALTTSALAGEATRSLVVLALLWVVAVVLVPATAGLFALGWIPLPTELELERRMVELRRLIEEEHGGPGSWRQRRWAVVDDYTLERRSARIQERRFAAQEEERRDLLARKLAQTELARALSTLSPMFLVQRVAEHLTGTGLERDRAFVRQSRAFGDELAATVRALDEEDPASPHLGLFSGYLSTRSVNADQLPGFEFRELSGRERLTHALPWLFLLLALTGLAALAAVLSMEHYEIR